MAHRNKYMFNYFIVMLVFTFLAWGIIVFLHWDFSKPQALLLM